MFDVILLAVDGSEHRRLPAQLDPEMIEGSIAEAIPDVANARTSDVVAMGACGCRARYSAATARH